MIAPSGVPLESTQVKSVADANTEIIPDSSKVQLDVAEQPLASVTVKMNVPTVSPVWSAAEGFNPLPSIEDQLYE